MLKVILVLKDNKVLKVPKVNKVILVLKDNKVLKELKVNKVQ